MHTYYYILSYEGKQNKQKQVSIVLHYMNHQGAQLHLLYHSGENYPFRGHFIHILVLKLLLCLLKSMILHLLCLKEHYLEYYYDFILWFWTFKVQVYIVLHYMNHWGAQLQLKTFHFYFSGLNHLLRGHLILILLLNCYYVSWKAWHCV